LPSESDLEDMIGMFKEFHAGFMAKYRKLPLGASRL
jgi:hypothetical protein